MSYNLKLSKQILYRLKRSYGVSVRLVQVGDATVSYETGVSTPVYTILNIDRVIKMPASMLRTFASNFQGMSGGAVDFHGTVFIIDVNDLPSDIVIDLQDYIEYDNKHWSIINPILSDDRQSYVLQVEALENRTPRPLANIIQGIGFSQAVS